jgi:hypothetical protein
MQTGAYVRSSSRLSSDERRQAIIEAIKDVFAKKGFDPTTSRDLAKAARVSEALLYKYFPTLSLRNVCPLEETGQPDGRGPRRRRLTGPPQPLKPFTNNWMATFEKCLKNAAASGDLREYPTTPHLSAWLLHHIALGLILHVSPRNPTDYKVPKHTLVRETVRFALRGIGLREEPIKRRYNSRFTCGVEK